MKLSIIVPVYNVEKYVGQCVESLFSVSVDENLYEIIVVNDGTMDNSMQNVNTIAKRHINVRIINQENAGLSVARNTGFSVANGEYIWFVDSDDWLCEDALTVVFNELERHKGVDVIATSLQWCYEDKTRNFKDNKFEGEGIITGREYFFKHYQYTAIQRFIIKKSFLDNNNLRFYPGMIHEDEIFGPQMIYCAESVIVMQEPIYNYRLREGSIMHSLSIRNAYALVKIYEENIKFMHDRVDINDHKPFKIIMLNEFQDAINYTWHLRNTAQFKEFLKETKSFRIQECMYAVIHGSIKEKIKFFILAFFPIASHRINTLYSNIRKSIGIVNK